MPALSTRHADANLGERQLLEHLAVRVERLRAQQQAGLLEIGPQFVSEAVGIFRIEFEHLDCRGPATRSSPSSLGLIHATAPARRS